MSADDVAYIMHHPTQAGFCVVHLIGDEGVNDYFLRHNHQLALYSNPGIAYRAALELECEYGVLLSMSVVEDITNTYVEYWNLIHHGDA